MTNVHLNKFQVSQYKEKFNVFLLFNLSLPLRLQNQIIFTLKKNSKNKGSTPGQVKKIIITLTTPKLHSPKISLEL